MSLSFNQSLHVIGPAYLTGLLLGLIRLYDYLNPERQNGYATATSPCIWTALDLGGQWGC